MCPGRYAHPTSSPERFRFSTALWSGDLPGGYTIKLFYLRESLFAEAGGQAYWEYRQLALPGNPTLPSSLSISGKSSNKNLPMNDKNKFIKQMQE